MQRTVNMWVWTLGTYSIVVLAVAVFVAMDWQTHDPYDPTFSGIWLFLAAPHAAMIVIAAGGLTGTTFIVAIVLVTLALNALTYVVIRRRACGHSVRAQRGSVDDGVSR